MHALSLSGSQVLHSRSVLTAMEARLPMLVLNSFKKGQGTAVCALDDTERPHFAGITRNKAKGTLSIAGKSADGESLDRLCRLLQAKGIDVLSSQLKEGLMCIQTSSENLEYALQLAHTEFFA